MSAKQIFKLDPAIFAKRQRKLRIFLFALIAFAIFAVLMIIRTFAPSQATSLSIIITIVFLMVAFYFVYFRITARMRRIYEYFRIEIRENELLLMQLDQQTIRIPRDTVKGIAREQDGRIRLDPKTEGGGIVFPPDLQHQDKLEKTLKKWLGKT